MAIQSSEKAIQQIREFFTTKFAAPSSPNQVAEDVWRALEHPLLKNNIFASSFLGIIDQSNMSYLYLSPQVKDFFAVDASVALAKGPDFLLSMVVPEDAAILAKIYKIALPYMLALPKEERMHFQFYYDYRINSPNGDFNLYQQTVPLVLNDQGLPYIVLAICSDTTPFKNDKAVHYKATLSLSGKPIKVLLSGNLGETTNLLTVREKEIVHHLAEGLNTDDVAEKLFISEGTVRTHRKNILEKTGAKNSVHLVRMAVANGWV